jgi:hypothetical protein
MNLPDKPLDLGFVALAFGSQVGTVLCRLFGHVSPKLINLVLECRYSFARSRLEGFDDLPVQ